MRNILCEPYDLDRLRTLSRDGQQRVSGIVAVVWHELVQHDENQFEEVVSRLVTGGRYGLADLDAKLVGCLGDRVLLEVSGDVSLLLDKYHEMMAEEAGE